MNRKLSRREKLFVSLAAGVVAAFLVCQLAVFPLVRQRQRLERQIRAQTEALSEMRALRMEYEALLKNGQRMTARLKARSRDFSLFSFVEALAGKTGVKPNIAYLKPSTARQVNGRHDVAQVEMQLKEIDLAQLVRYLHGVESSADLVYVNRISISRNGKSGDKIDVILQVETIEG